MFHAIEIRHYNPPLARDAIQAVLDAQSDDGFIPHVISPTSVLTITQPPILAFGVEQVARLPDDLEWVRAAYPRLVAYLRWNEQNRDSDGNGLLEWFIEEHAQCRGESGMGNSPRFDDAIQLDAEDFNAFLRRRIAEPVDGIEVVHSTLDDYLAELQQHADKVETVLEGELREPALYGIDRDAQWLIPGVLSSRAPLKQANARCQTLLCHWAEPMSHMAHAVLGRAYPAGFLDVAWRWLLQNHPHDSICGCSIDRVHQDMAYRFSQCEQIGERLTTEATTALAAHVEGEPESDELRVVVFNPLPEPVEETVELTLPLPTAWPLYPSHGGILREPMFHVFDDTGAELPVQKLSQAWNRSRFRTFDSRFPQTYPVHEARVSVPVSVPAMGYTTLRVRGGDPVNHARVELGRSLVTGALSMENEHLSVAIEADGSSRSPTNAPAKPTHACLLTRTPPTPATAGTSGRRSATRRTTAPRAAPRSPSSPTGRTSRPSASAPRCGSPRSSSSETPGNGRPASGTS